jgi:hypothetical protein
MQFHVIGIKAHNLSAILICSKQIAKDANIFI